VLFDSGDGAKPVDAVMISGDRPLVSVSIPTFNRARSYLPAALASVCSQTYEKVEIFVSDNASEDETKELVTNIGDSRIRYHRHSTNIGPSQNMNFCVQQARGELLVVLSDDDIVAPDFVESCVQLAATHPDVGLIRTGTRVIDAQGQTIREVSNVAQGLSFDEYLLAWIDGKVSPYQCSTMFRTELLQAHGLHSRHFLFDDVMAHFEIAAHHGVVDIRDVKASFRQHSEELTAKSDIRAWCEESLDLIDLMCRLSPKNAEYISTRGLSALALANYRRALRQPFPKSVLSCLTVFRMHRFTPPPRRVLSAAVVRRLRRTLLRTGRVADR
jgi:glycosyltransferase involved in cell wall biosynthesis